LNKLVVKKLFDQKKTFINRYKFDRLIYQKTNVLEFQDFKPSIISTNMFMISLGKGQNYKNHNIKNQKEHQKNSKPSEHQKCPSIFHKSDQNVENQKYQVPMAYYLWLPKPVGG
jgi:hypothetical protein